MRQSFLEDSGSVFVRGIGWAAAGGMGQGRSNTSFTFNMGGGPPVSLTAGDILKGVVHSRLGRLDAYSKLGIAAIARALEDAGMDNWKKLRPIGLIVSTVRGSLAADTSYYETVIPQEGRLASPNKFVYTLPSCFLGDAAILFGLTGMSFAVHEDSLSGLSGLEMAVRSITMGDHDVMLVGICDVECPSLFRRKEEVFSGAAFIVVCRSYTCRAYGRLTIDRDRGILCNGRNLTDMNDLIKRCIRNLAGSQGHEDDALTFCREEIER